MDKKKLAALAREGAETAEPKLASAHRHSHLHSARSNAGGVCLAGMDNGLFVSKYQLELPKKEDVQRFIEEQVRETES